MKHKNVFFLLAIFASLSSSDAYLAIDSQRRSKYPCSNFSWRQNKPTLFASEEGNIESSQGIWLPPLRQVMGSIASAGALETGYLTYTKLSGDLSPLCGVNGDCNSVLSGPYSNVPFTEIPIAGLGFLAYTSVVALAFAPLLRKEMSDDSFNRLLLANITTAMGIFSIFLMTLLYGVLHTNCPFCVFSAICSIFLASLAWIGGCLPEDNSKFGVRSIAVSALATTVAAITFFVSVDDSSAKNSVSSSTSSSSSSVTTLLAQTAGMPPAITTQSSERALILSRNLEALDAKMYGAYWCSHCYDQKEVLGKEAFSKVKYIECSKEGVNSQANLCKEKKVPGYPTWEIQGELYPGQRELDELEDLVQDLISERQ